MDAGGEAPLADGSRALVAKGAEAALVVVVIASLVFLCLRLLPGDPARLAPG